MKIHGGTLVTRRGLSTEEIAVDAHGPDIDATGLHILPGCIDVHLHFNEPGRTEWEGASTGSRALAAGGGVMFFDMPLNSTPCTLNAHEFDRKRAALENASIADFGIWGGVVPGNRDEMAELAERGAVGFKAFMCDSGLPEFPRADDHTLFEAMTEAARLNLPVAVHAENNDLARGTSRPVLAEVEAISRSCLMAAETGVKLHIVHVSTGRGIRAAHEARARGADVSLETCPHYLYFTEDDVEQLGAIGKCAPPLRSASDRAELRECVENGLIDLIASDHSPAPPELKFCEYAHAWGGVAGVQSTLSVLLDMGLPLPEIARLTRWNPLERFSITERPGDFTLIDLNGVTTFTPDSMHHRHKLSPYAGRTLRGRIRRTIRRGETIYLDGAFPPSSPAQLIRPTK